MQTTYEALNVFVFLIPGFIASIIFNNLLVRKEKDNFSKIIEALVMSFLIYTVVSGLIGHSPVILETIKEGNITKYSIRYNATVLLPIALLAIFIPIVFGFLVTTDFHMRLFRFLRITNKTSRETVWIDVFTDQKRYIIVNLKNGRRVFGWPMYYSNTPEEGMIYLYDAAWIDDQGKYIELDIHGLFLVEPCSIESIEFTNIDKEKAKELTKEKGN